MCKSKSGEIATILTLVTLVIIGVSTMLSSQLLKSSQNKLALNTKAGEIKCPGGSCDHCGKNDWWDQGCFDFDPSIPQPANSNICRCSDVNSCVTYDQDTKRYRQSGSNTSGIWCGNDCRTHPDATDHPCGAVVPTPTYPCQSEPCESNNQIYFSYNYNPDKPGVASEGKYYKGKNCQGNSMDTFGKYYYCNPNLTQVPTIQPNRPSISPNVPTTPSPAPVTTVATTPGTTTAPIAPIVPTRPGIGAIANKVTYHFKGKVINTASNPGNLDNLRISPNAADKDLDVNVTESTNLNKINATTGSYEVGLIIHNPQKLSTHKCYISVMTDNKVIKDTSQFPCTNGNTYIVEDISINYPKPLGPIEAATPTISIQNQKITINVVLNYQSVNCDSGKFWLSSIGTKYKDGNTVDYKRNFYFVSNQGNLTKKETHTLEFSKYPIRDITINTYALGYNNGVSKYISTPEKKYSTSINQNSISEQIEQDCSK